MPSAIRSVNPASGETIRKFLPLTVNEIESKLALAETAYRSWRETGFRARAELLLKMAALLRKNVNSLAETAVLEMGKPTTQARAEVLKCALVCEYYAEHGEEHLSPRAIKTDADESGVRYDPIGPVLAVMPWNFPYWQVFRFLAPALMAGNVGLLKHSSNVSLCSLAIENLVRESGGPEGVFQSLIITSAQVESVIRDRRVRAVTLTGSDPAGRAVASVAGAVLKKSVMELGGNDPFIVLADADVASAAKVGATARLINNGQSCIAAKRFIIAREILDE